MKSNVAAIRRSSSARDRTSGLVNPSPQTCVTLDRPGYGDMGPGRAVKRADRIVRVHVRPAIIGLSIHGLPSHSSAAMRVDHDPSQLVSAPKPSAQQFRQP